MEETGYGLKTMWGTPETESTSKSSFTIAKQENLKILTQSTYQPPKELLQSMSPRNVTKDATTGLFPNQMVEKHIGLNTV